MMTVIEKQTMDAVISLNRKTKDANQIDWEQRRYEIAKEVMGTEAYHGAFSEYHGAFSEDAAKYAVACADALIKVLKEQPQP